MRARIDCKKGGGKSDSLTSGQANPTRYQNLENSLRNWMSSARGHSMRNAWSFVRWTWVVLLITYKCEIISVCTEQLVH